MNDVVEMTLLNGAICHSGQLTCPECGERSMLVVVADPAELVDEPALIRCPFDHVWSEPGLPRRDLAELVAGAAKLDPETWNEMIRVIRERGVAILPGMALRLVDGPGPGAG